VLMQFSWLFYKSLGEKCSWKSCTLDVIDGRVLAVGVDNVWYYMDQVSLVDGRPVLYVSLGGHTLLPYPNHYILEWPIQTTASGGREHKSLPVLLEGDDHVVKVPEQWDTAAGPYIGEGLDGDSRLLKIKWGPNQTMVPGPPADDAEKTNMISLDCNLALIILVVIAALVTAAVISIKAAWTHSRDRKKHRAAAAVISALKSSASSAAKA
jgi:hypothetical protein